MPDDSAPPFRSSNGSKLEQIVVFYDSYGENGEIVDSCVSKANRWLKEFSGKVDIILRDYAVDAKNLFAGIFIWYQMK